ncbi:hypothetical protein GW17_00053916 [Ensete ventricosum]|nr:hypothetical protein GW17_00053916 [Ensete ventricosum]
MICGVGVVVVSSCSPGFFTCDPCCEVWVETMASVRGFIVNMVPSSQSRKTAYFPSPQGREPSDAYSQSSKEELRESSTGGSPFVLEIQDKPIPQNFRLPTLEAYNGSFDLMEHTTTFRAQMTLYGTTDTLMCRAFLTTLRGPSRIWYTRLKPSSIFCFD